MKGTETCSEESIGRLVRAAFGGEARLGAHRRELVKHCLLSRPSPGGAEATFPTALIAALAGVLAVLAGWLVGWKVGVAVVPGGAQALHIAAAVLIVNITFVPVTSILVVARRKRHA